MHLRMTVRRWMILAAVFGVFLFCLVLKRRSDYFRERVIHYARLEAYHATTAAQLEALAREYAKMPDPLLVHLFFPGNTNRERSINFVMEAAKMRIDEDLVES